MKKLRSQVSAVEQELPKPPSSSQNIALRASPIAKNYGFLISVYPAYSASLLPYNFFEQ